MKKIIPTILLLITISFAFGFFSGVKKLFPYNLAKAIHSSLSGAELINNLDDCDIESIVELPGSFTVFIGHAYGSPLTSTVSDFIAPKVERFIQSNKKSIQGVVFTGDVFSVPSSTKWQKLYEQFNGQDIHIAPGNHDVLRPDSREVFKRQKFIKQGYPYHLTSDSIKIIVSDSISNKWELGLPLKDLLEASSSDVIVARHNIVISELRSLANSRAGASALPTAKELVGKLRTGQQITWVMGDGGAFSHLPRITCKKFQNHKFIVNGIGEVEGDIVLILNKGKLFKYSLSQKASK